MITITTEGCIDVLCHHSPAVCINAVQGDAYTRAVECDLYAEHKPWIEADGSTVYVHYQLPDGTTGKYDLLPDGQVAGSVTGNKLHVLLSPDVTRYFGLVRIWVQLQKGDNKISLPDMHLFLQMNPLWNYQSEPIDRSEICSPHAHARIVEVRDGNSAVDLTISGIYEGFVTGISLEYILRPIEYNNPVTIPVEIGEFDLVNGHIYTASIPVDADFFYRAVLHYMDKDGNASNFESRWEIAPCSACGGIHSSEYLNFPHNNPVLFTYINPYRQINTDQTVVEVRASSVNATVTNLYLEYTSLPVNDEFEDKNINTAFGAFNVPEYIYTDSERAVAVHIDVEDRDYLSGHSEWITIPVSSGYACRAVMHYRQHNGCERIMVSKWNVIDFEIPE